MKYALVGLMSLGLIACSQEATVDQSPKTAEATAAGMGDSTAEPTSTAAAPTSAYDGPIPMPTSTAAAPTSAYDGPIPMPIKVGGSATVDACGNASRVANLDAAGYASVRDAPSDAVKERDRLMVGQMVVVCASEGGWSGIVYAKDGEPKQVCEVGTPIAVQRNYTGPCSQGWVESKNLKQVAR